MPADLTLRGVRRRCAAIARTVHIPEPFDLQVFLDRLSATRGRPIRLLTVDLPTGAPCGLCVSTDTTDYIAVTASASGAQRDHITLHEVAHLLLGHQLPVLDATDGTRPLFQHLDPAAIRAMFARGGYSTLAEQEAETLASLLGQRAGLWRPPPPKPPPDPRVTQLGRSLEHP